MALPPLNNLRQFMAYDGVFDDGGGQEGLLGMLTPSSMGRVNPQGIRDTYNSYLASSGNTSGSLQASEIPRYPNAEDKVRRQQNRLAAAVAEGRMSQADADAALAAWWYNRGWRPGKEPGFAENLVGNLPGNAGEFFGSGQELLDTYGLGDALALDPYGNSRVNMTPEELNIIALVNGLIQGDTGRFRSFLEGTPDNGLLDRAVLNPMRQTLTNRTLPQLADIYSGGAYGENYWGGARQGAQERALYQSAQDQAGQLYLADQAAQDRALQAQGMLPGMMGIQGQERANDIANRERDIRVHFQNQGLNVAENQAALQSASLALQGANAYNANTLAQLQLWMQWQQMQQANAQGGMEGVLGGALGSLPGLLTGNPMLALGGAQAGSGLGYALSGNPVAAGQGFSSSLNTYALSNLLGGMNPNPTPNNPYQPQGGSWY